MQEAIQSIEYQNYVCNTQYFWILENVGETLVFKLRAAMTVY